MGVLIKFIFLILSFSVMGTVVPERDDKGRAIQRAAGVHSDESTHVRFTGTHDFNIVGNATTSSDWTIPQLQYGGVNVDSIMQGLQYKTVGGCDGDRVKFEVVHPVAGVVETFAEAFYVFKDEVNIVKEHRALLPAGLKIRVTYESTCANAARFIANIYRYIEI